METAFARLEGRNFEFYMAKRRVVVGRNSKLGDVDVNMGTSRFISRKHFEITLERNCFFLLCRGKNGVFVDDVFQRRENRRLQLPSACMIRFPSTQIKLAFTSLLEELGPGHAPLMPSPLNPLRMDPLQSPFVSPMPSPTGTISAVNSCPTSPSAGDYRHRLSSFDFMAKYAQKLLASHSDSDVRSEVNSITEEEEGEEEGEDGADHEAKAALDERAEGEAPIEVPADESGEAKAVDKSGTKPPFSYAQLIVQALLAARDHRQTLSNIYNYIAEQFPYYKLEDKGWKNSIRHNLSLNQYFMKAPREKEGLGFGKGGYWCMHPDYEDKLSSQAFVKRKKKGIPVFPSAGMISRSAPPSPTHHPLMRPEFNPRELEAKFGPSLCPAPTSHFTLPSFFSQMTAASTSSHSLPASPSRPAPLGPAPLGPAPLGPAPLGPGHVRFFQPLLHSVSTEALALERVRKPTIEPIREEAEEPQTKRLRLEEPERLTVLAQGRGGPELVGAAPRAAIPVPTITPLSSVPFPPGAGGAASGSGGVQFISVPMVTSAGMPASGGALLSQPLSSFFPQNFFTGVPGSSPAPLQQHPGGSSGGEG